MHALGLTLAGDPGGLGLVPGEAEGGRRCELRPAAAEDIEAAWREARAERVHEQRHPDGHVLFAVDRDASLGFRMAAPGFGVQWVAPDGRRIGVARPAGGEPWRDRPLLFGRALPVAAVLQGVEVLHASAVVLGGRLLALAAASGTGKSSLAAHLVAEGAEFFTDDVLAVEKAGGTVHAHPGPRWTKVAAREHEMASAAGRARLGRRIGEDDGELLLEPPTTLTARPLDALYVLRRHGAGPATIRPAPPDPRLLLATTYVFDVETPERLEAQLDLCASLAASVPVFAVTLPADGTATAAADLVAGHVTAGAS